MTLPLEGQTALVTGAARGIGRAIAAALGEAGAEVVLFDRDDLSDTVAQLGTKARAVRGDVSVETDVLRLFSQLDRLDIAVNCAGIQVIRPLLETTAADFDIVVGINLRGTFLIGREAARLMLKAPSSHPPGRIINISSELAYLGRTDYSLYCATKGAVLSLTRSWAREFAPRILVNAVAPGPTETAMLSLETLTPEQRQQELTSVPLGRLATPAEVAATVLFLATAGGQYYTGACLSPNGGAVMF